MSPSRFSRYGRRRRDDDDDSFLRSLEDQESSSRPTSNSSRWTRQPRRNSRDSFRQKDVSDGYFAAAEEGKQEEEEEEEIYIVQQKYGYCAILFSMAQTVVLGLMMWQCGIAPLRLNPMLGPYPDALSEWGGKNSVLILEDDEIWRLATPVMLHAGVFHLIGNVAVQMEMGVFFEKEWGSVRWLIVYLSSGIAASVLSTIYMPRAVSVGSSGAVMGLFGAKLAELLLRTAEAKITREQIVAGRVRREQGWAVTLSVIVVMSFSFVPFVDWAAHLGGLIAGFFVGVMLFAFYIDGCLWKTAWFAVGAALTLVATGTALDAMYGGNVEIIEELRDVCGYYKENLEDYECTCMRDEYFANGGQ